MEKTNYSVARVQTYTRESIIKAERHNERKNISFLTIDIKSQNPPFFQYFEAIFTFLWNFL